MSSHFLAYMARMKLIRRWGLRRGTRDENDMEHSLLVAMIAHTLAVLRRERYHAEVDMGKLLEYAIYHEAAEVITGDLAAPIKYFNPEIKAAFHRIETVASEKLISYLPEDLRAVYRTALFPAEESDEWKLVKAADKIAAYVKCVEESGAGNHEFESARISLGKDIEGIGTPEAEDFMREFAASFALSLDALN